MRASRAVFKPADFLLHGFDVDSLRFSRAGLINKRLFCPPAPRPARDACIRQRKSFAEFPTTDVEFFAEALHKVQDFSGFF